MKYGCNAWGQHHSDLDIFSDFGIFAHIRTSLEVGLKSKHDISCFLKQAKHFLFSQDLMQPRLSHKLL